MARRAAEQRAGKRQRQQSARGFQGEQMSNPFAAFCDDFYVNMRLGSQLNLPHQRETLLHFFERVQKQFPTMSRFRKNENNELNLEEDRGSESYRWLSVEQKRVSAGHVNPGTVEESLKLHTMLLE